MNYTLNQLRVFVKVVELQSITKSSEALHMTQPAVSIQLKNFQNQFEIPLYEIIGRQFYVTDFGKEIAATADKILEEVDLMQYKASHHKGELVGKLKISVVSTGKYLMPYFLSDFVQKYPRVELNMDVTNKTTVVKHLEQNEVDFALVSVLPDHLSTFQISLVDNVLNLVGKNIEETPDKMSLKQLINKSLIYREPGSATRSVMENYLARSRIDIQKKLELTSNEAVKQAVISGLGYSVMPMIGLKNELKNGDIKTIKIPGLPIRTQWNLVWLKDKNLSIAAEAYRIYLEENKHALIQEHFGWYEKGIL